MHRLMTHLRGLMVALAALALTAGVAFAARPAASTGPERASNSPVTSELAEEGEGTVPELNDDEDESTDEDADEDESTDEDADEDADEVTVDDAADTERPMNHGWYVSQAAKSETPEGYRNHGEYVSEVARSDAGKKGSEDEAEDAPEAEAGTDDGDAAATTAKAKGKERAAQAKAHKAERKTNHKSR